MCCHIEKRGKWNASFPLYSRCQKQSPGPFQCSHPQPGLKTTLNFPMCQHRQAKASYQKTVDAASDSKLRPKAKLPQRSETWVSSADQTKTCQLQLKSPDRCFLFTDPDLRLPGPLPVYTNPCIAATKRMSWGKPGISNRRKFESKTNKKWRFCCWSGLVLGGFYLFRSHGLP